MTIINELKLSKDLIRFPSVTPKDAGAIKFLSKKLKKLGFNCKILEFKDKKSKPIKNLYARIGKKGPNFATLATLMWCLLEILKDWTLILLNQKKKNYLIGRGANDMKSSIACFASAVSKFLNKNQKFNGSISFLITGDEEGYAINGTKKVVDYLKEREKKLIFVLLENQQIQINLEK